MFAHARGHEGPATTPVIVSGVTHFVTHLWLRYFVLAG
jgi:hypothetical protein